MSGMKNRKDGIGEGYEIIARRPCGAEPGTVLPKEQATQFENEREKLDKMMEKYKLYPSESKYHRSARGTVLYPKRNYD